jgi:hypothetical protein
MDSTTQAPPSTSKPNGRPPFVATDDKKTIVKDLARLGLPHDQIAFSLKIGVKTLRKHFRHELYDSAIAANKAVLEKLLSLAVDGNTTAATFWARTRCQFRTGGSPLDEQTLPPNDSASGSPTLEIVNNDGEPLGNW